MPCSKRPSPLTGVNTNVAVLFFALLMLCPPPPLYVYDLQRPALEVPDLDETFLRESPPVIWAESRGDPEAVNPTSGTCGLYQIHPIHWRRFNAWSDCTDPAANQRVAHAIWLEQGWRPWGR